MKTIIAGSRDINDLEHVHAAIKSAPWTITEVVSGCARGVDRLGERWAELNGVKVARFPADWDRHGKAAGYLRNAEMAAYADALIAVWDGVSRGTKHMISRAEAEGILVHIHRTR